MPATALSPHPFLVFLSGWCLTALPPAHPLCASLWPVIMPLWMPQGCHGATMHLAFFALPSMHSAFQLNPHQLCHQPAPQTQISPNAFTTPCPAQSRSFACAQALAIALHACLCTGCKNRSEGTHSRVPGAPGPGCIVFADRRARAAAMGARPRGCSVAPGITIAVGRLPVVPLRSRALRRGRPYHDVAVVAATVQLLCCRVPPAVAWASGAAPTLGLHSTARAKANRCFSPPLSR